MVKIIIPKRTSKNITIEQYEEQKNLNKNQDPLGNLPKKFINIDKRYRYLRPTQKLKQLDLNVAHYLDEVNILPYSHTDKNIG